MGRHRDNPDDELEKKISRSYREEGMSPSEIAEARGKDPDEVRRALKRHVENFEERQKERKDRLRKGLDMFIDIITEEFERNKKFYRFSPENRHKLLIMYMPNSTITNMNLLSGRTGINRKRISQYFQKKYIPTKEPAMEICKVMGLDYKDVRERIGVKFRQTYKCYSKNT